MGKTKIPYQMLLGRPWLRNAKAIHDWEKNHITIHKDSQKLIIEFEGKTTILNSQRPSDVEDYDWYHGLSEEEEALFDNCPELVEIAEADLYQITPEVNDNATKFGLGSKILETQPNKIIDETDSKLEENTRVIDSTFWAIRQS